MKRMKMAIALKSRHEFFPYIKCKFPEIDILFCGGGVQPPPHLASYACIRTIDIDRTFVMQKCCKSHSRQWRHQHFSRIVGKGNVALCRDRSMWTWWTLLELCLHLHYVHTKSKMPRIPSSTVMQSLKIKLSVSMVCDYAVDILRYLNLPLVSTFI